MRSGHTHAGNGLTDPVIQYGAYADFALQKGIITQSQRDHIQSYYPRCKELIEKCNSDGVAFDCRKAKFYCSSMIFSEILREADHINYYDIRTKCSGYLCYDFSLLDKYLAQDSVRLPGTACSAVCLGFYMRLTFSRVSMPSPRSTIPPRLIIDHNAYRHRSSNSERLKKMALQHCVLLQFQVVCMSMRQWEYHFFMSVVMIVRTQLLQSGTIGADSCLVRRLTVQASAVKSS